MARDVNTTHLPVWPCKLETKQTLTARLQFSRQAGTPTQKNDWVQVHGPYTDRDSLDGIIQVQSPSPNQYDPMDVSPKVHSAPIPLLRAHHPVWEQPARVL